MHSDHKGCHQKRKEKIHNARSVKVKGIYHQGIKESGGNAGSRDDLGRGKHESENQNKHQENQRVDQKNGNGTDDHTFSAFEFEINGEDVSEHTEKACYILTGAAHQAKADHNRKKGFQNVAGKREKASLFTEGAEHIGHACIAGAEVSHIVSVDFFGNDYSRVNAAQKVSGDRGCNEEENQPQKNFISAFSVHEKAPILDGFVKKVSHASSFVLSLITN